VCPPCSFSQILSPHIYCENYMFLVRKHSAGKLDFASSQAPKRDHFGEFEGDLRVGGFGRGEMLQADTKKMAKCSGSTALNRALAATVSSFRMECGRFPSRAV
jgi:hypothetical protein